MIIYIPRLIESAEQAEALPEGAIFWTQRPYGFRYDYGTVGKGGVALASDWIDEPDTLHALVPIEAEEEWEDDGRPVWNIGEGEATPADVDDYERRNGRRPSRRLVTPWVAQDPTESAGEKVE